MSHVEPEHNRPQEGEEPDEPFPFDPPYRIDKPTTGEWTPESVRLMAVVNTKGAEKIADAHKDALTAERGAGQQQRQAEWENYCVTIQQLREQLAAKDELHAAALQVLERHHQKKLDAAVEVKEWLHKTKVSMPCDIEAALARIGEQK